MTIIFYFRRISHMNSFLSFMPIFSPFGIRVMINTTRRLKEKIVPLNYLPYTGNRYCFKSLFPCKKNPKIPLSFPCQFWAVFPLIL
jgi:hypothetical protein